MAGVEEREEGRSLGRPERLLSAEEGAELLGMSERTLQLKAQTRQIGCVRDGRLVKFRARHIAEYIAAHEQPAIPPQVPATPHGAGGTKARRGRP